MDILSASLMLFLIMDPLGNLPIFMSMLKHLEPKRRRIVMIRELVFALIIMISFLFMGQQILGFLNLKPEAVSISGGIILFIVAIRMIFPQPGGVAGLAAGEEPFIVPMATPFIAGPSVLASLMLLAHQESDRMLDWTLALLLAWSISASIFMMNGVFTRWLGDKGLKALERLMGMLLIMLAVQMFLNGVRDYINTF